MIPHFIDDDINMFKKYIKNSKIYFEYGSGGSTHYVSTCSNIEKFYSVESDGAWIEKLKPLISDLIKCNFIYILCFRVVTMSKVVYDFITLSITSHILPLFTLIECNLWIC